MGDIIRERKAQFKKAYGLIRLIRRYSTATVMLSGNAMSDKETKAYEALHWQKHLLFNQLDKMGFTISSNAVYVSNSLLDKDRYSDWEWLRIRDILKYSEIKQITIYSEREYDEDLWYDEDEYDEDLWYDEDEYYEDDDDWDVLIKERVVLTCDGLYKLQMFQDQRGDYFYHRFPLYYTCAPDPSSVQDIPF